MNILQINVDRHSEFFERKHNDDDKTNKAPPYASLSYNSEKSNITLKMK